MRSVTLYFLALYLPITHRNNLFNGANTQSLRDNPISQIFNLDIVYE